MPRLEDLKRFYSLMDRLESNIGGRRTLGETRGGRHWPSKGVYFFFEDGERRTGSGKGDRIVRVGSHAVSEGRTSDLWPRIRSHRGRLRSRNGGEPLPLRGSNFRKWVAIALFVRNSGGVFSGWPDITGMNLRDMWNLNQERQRRLESAIRAHMWPMELTFVPVDCWKHRACIEQNAIGLLSEFGRGNPVDPPSSRWLGLEGHLRSERINGSGLWNDEHVANGYDPQFLDMLARYVEHAG